MSQHNRGNETHQSDKYFEAMRCCRHFVIANSTFSWWAAWLGEQEGSVVVAPRRWFEDPKRDSGDIVPPRWALI